MRMRRKQVHEVWLYEEGSLAMRSRDFDILVEGCKSPEAAGRKALRVAWRKMGAILASTRVSSVCTKSMWY